MDIEALKQAVAAAKGEALKSAAALRVTERQYVSALADSLGLCRGAVIKTKGPKGKRYRITSVSSKGYGDPPFRIHAALIRKDGSSGADHEIWDDYDLESAPELVQP